jgi:hypothetical protein
MVDLLVRVEVEAALEVVQTDDLCENMQIHDSQLPGQS